MIGLIELVERVQKFCDCEDYAIHFCDDCSNYLCSDCASAHDCRGE